VSVCLGAKPLLEADGLKVRVVSMPSWTLFDLLEEDAQETVLPADVPTLAVEAAASFGWDRWADDTVSIDRFGASAPGSAVMEKFGFTPTNVADRARQLLAELDEED
jgi:transketolase